MAGHFLFFSKLRNCLALLAQLHCHPYVALVFLSIPIVLDQNDKTTTRQSTTINIALHFYSANSASFVAYRKACIKQRCILKALLPLPTHTPQARHPAGVFTREALSGVCFSWRS